MAAAELHQKPSRPRTPRGLKKKETEQLVEFLPISMQCVHFTETLGLLITFLSSLKGMLGRVESTFGLTVHNRPRESIGIDPGQLKCNQFTM